jgi:dihydrofolate synthase/folylpolyglutamate synthase
VDERAALAEWLRRLEARNEARIELGLDRVRTVLDRLPVAPPSGRVFTVAGTNGKGSTTGILAAALAAAGVRTGHYTSPHLRRYTERVRIAGREIDAAGLVAAFAAVEAAAAGVPLTYFEFGTLAAAVAFTAGGCEAWVLEVGLGGRLDAVNAIDPDWSLITTIGLDHQEYLGDTIEAIAGEKAGILRPGRPAFYGDAPVPRAIAGRARELGTPLALAGTDFGYRPVGPGWEWWGSGQRRAGLPALPGWTDAQYRNGSLALAALAAADPRFVPAIPDLAGVLAAGMPAGRCQRLRHGPHEWVLDVAHNPQAAGVLAAQLAALPAADTTVVAGLLADKSVPGFVAALAPGTRRWIAAGLDGPRGQPAGTLAAELRAAGAGDVRAEPSPAAAFAAAVAATPAGGRIVACGSFRVVGPALDWLGLY